jgi:hypothetical protein
VEAGDELAASGELEGALAEYAGAHAEQPDNAELAFWHGVALALNGREQEARGPLGQAFGENDGWRELLRRLPATGLLPADEQLVDRLTHW